MLGTGHGAPGQPAVPPSARRRPHKRAPRNPARPPPPPGRAARRPEAATPPGAGPDRPLPAAPVLPPLLPSRTPGPPMVAPVPRDPVWAAPVRATRRRRSAARSAAVTARAARRPRPAPAARRCPGRGTFTPGMGSTPDPRGGAAPTRHGLRIRPPRPRPLSAPTAPAGPGSGGFAPGPGDGSPVGGRFLPAPPPLPLALRGRHAGRWSRLTERPTDSSLVRPSHAQHRPG